MSESEKYPDWGKIAMDSDYEIQTSDPHDKTDPYNDEMWIELEDESACVVFEGSGKVRFHHTKPVRFARAGKTVNAADCNLLLVAALFDDKNLDLRSQLAMRVIGEMNSEP